MTTEIETERPPTRTEWADQRLRAAILQGTFTPGERLVISTLAEQLGISATPLREALGRLSSEGLVDLQAHGSARVAQVDLHEATEIYELRRILEPMALERAVAKSDAAYRDEVTRTWEALATRRVANPSDHAAFHRALLAGCDSGWLLRLTSMLADRAGLMIAVGLPGRPSSYSTAEAHRHLKDLAIGGDATLAAQELTRHLDSTIKALQSVLTGSSSTTH